MKRKIKTNIFMYYLAVGIVISIYTNVFPKLYEVLGFSKMQISLLIAIPFVGALFQPIIGFLSDYTKQYKKVLEILFWGLILTTIALFFVTQYFLFVIILFIISVLRFPIFVLSDNVILQLASNHDFNFGTVKKGASFGFGASLILTMPLYIMFGIQSIMVTLLALLIIAIVQFRKVPEIEIEKFHEQEKLKLSDIKLITNNRMVVLLISFQILFMSVSSLKFSYQILKFSSITDSVVAPALALCLATVPEILFLHLYPRIKNKLNISTLSILFVIPIINIVQMTIFLISNSPLVLIFASMLHGFGMMFYIPGYISYLREVTDEKLRATTMVLGTTLQALGALMIGIILIPIYNIYHIQGVYLTFIVVLILSLIPLAVIKISKEK